MGYDESQEFFHIYQKEYELGMYRKLNIMDPMLMAKKKNNR
jgi:hypothetical protein